MATIRVNKNKNYVVLNNTALEDENLSFKAKGIFAYLMSKPDDWKCQVKDLKNHSKDGRDSIYSGLKELKEHGYMIKRPLKDETNRIIEWEEILFETPQEDAKNIYKEQKIKNELAAIKKAETIKNKKPHTENPEEGKATYGKPVSGKPVDIINTDIINTDITSSSSNLKNEFENNICELKKTTIKKFSNYIEQYENDFILAIIEYCAEVNIKSFAGFKKVIDSYIEKNILNRQDLLADIEKYRLEKSKKKVNKNNYSSNKKDRFNDFDQRNYTKEDFKNLEDKLFL